MSRYLKSASARILAIVSQFLLIALLGHVSGPQATGIYATVFSFASICAIVMSLGQIAASVKEIPSLLREGDRSRATNVAVRSLQISALGASAFALPATWLGTVVTGSFLHGLLACAMSAALAFANTFGAIARSFGSVFLSESVKTVLWRLAAVSLLVGALLSSSNPGIEWVLITAVTGVVVSVAVAAYLLVNNQSLKPALQSLASLKSGSKVDLTNWLLQTVQAMILNVDVVLVGLLLGMADAGSYFVLTRMASIVALPLSVTNPVILPAVSRLAKQGPEKLLEKAIRRNALMNIASAGFLVVVLYFFKDAVFNRLSGGSMTRMEHVSFVLLIASQFVNTAVGPTSFSSQLFDVRRHAMWILLVCLAGFMTTMAVVAGNYGLIGVAAAVSFWRIGQNIATYWLIASKGGFDLLRGRYVKPV